ncbi:MAG TPA: hypothetical protein VFL36_15065 [Myxococcales bacterium]|nr:hypothetical protein [Myxococcales bacterium]
MIRTGAAVFALALTASAAQAAAPGTYAGAPGHWSVATGETVSPNADAFRFDLGWPGISFTYLHGTSDRSDMGLQFDLLYGWESTNRSKFGFGFGVPFRIVVNRKDKVTIGLHIDPGIRVYTGDNVTGGTDFFLRFPVGGILGVQVTPELRLAATIDLNMATQFLSHNFGPDAFLEIGPQFGFAAEYAVDRSLDVGLNVRFGPQFYTFSASPTDFAFTTAVVIGYRL